MENFTLHVEDFGKIESATVKLAPFTLFVGDNNSGKSYLMALIYGLFAGSSVSFDMLPQYALYLEDILKNFLSNDNEQTYIFSEKDFACFEKIINESIERKKTAFVAGIFNREIPIGKIWIELHGTNTLSLSKRKELTFDKTEKAYMLLTEEINGQKQVGLRWNRDGALNSIFLIHNIALYLLGGYQHTPIFLPASRTGFMLTYRSLIKHSIEKSFLGGADKPINNATILTKPCIDFLTNVSDFSYEQQKQEYHKDITDFIESNIMQGRLSVNQLPTPDITYIPKGLDEGIPMHVSSGVVTETAPLVLALSNPAIDYLQIEEPEMCLHPKLQKEMARALIRIVNSGMPVLASTHSDIILQHVNNILRLKNHPNCEKIMRELGYNEEDLLKHEDVKVYQFDSSEMHSSVNKIEFDTEDGFAAPTFTDSLSKLLDETMYILREDQ